MTSIGYVKSKDANRVLWKPLYNINLDFSYDSDSKFNQFYGEDGNCHLLIYCLGLVDAFKQYFKIAS